jgi:hypothetical protein
VGCERRSAVDPEALLRDDRARAGARTGTTWSHGARWIMRKRFADDGWTQPHAGLLPAGFSAEHLGPERLLLLGRFLGRRRACAMRRCYAQRRGERAADEFQRESEALPAHGSQSCGRRASRLRRAAMPASPYRRLDAGAYRLDRSRATRCNCAPGRPEAARHRGVSVAEVFRQDGAFFQDMIHSGMNRLPDTARGASAAARRRSLQPYRPVDTVRTGIADRPVAGGDSPRSSAVAWATANTCGRRRSGC